MLVYLIRHAQSIFNVDPSVGLDSGLSDLGRMQALALARRLAPAAVTAIYSSPFTRCLQTAAAIHDVCRLPVRIHPHLWEYHHLEPGTDLQTGLADVEVICRRMSFAIPCPDYHGPMHWPPIDEPISALIERVQAFAAFLKQRWTGADDVAVVISHGSPVARLLEAWLTDLPGPSFRFVIENAAVTALRYEAGLSSLVCMNELSHLHGLGRPEASNFNADGTVKFRRATSYW